jgi:putative peptidoglycan lipid II flippase
MKPETSGARTIFRSAGTVSIAVFASRILGLIREQVFAAMFGAGYAYDAFIVAFRIPNLLRDLFAEGALSSAFVAVFTDYKTNKGSDATWQLANNVITAVMLVVGFISLLGIFLSKNIVSIISPEFSLVPGKQELTILMTSIMFPFLLLISLSAVVMGILNTMGKFFVPAMASSYFNLGSIISGIAFAFILPGLGFHPIVGMAIGVMIGGVLQLGVQIPSLKKQGFQFKPYVKFSDKGLIRIFKLMVPAIIGLSATQINIFINTIFASSCAEGSVSWLSYAFRILMFPIGLVGVSLSIATMPVISSHASKGDMPMLKKDYVSSTVLSFIFSVPATFGLIFLSQPIIRVIFEHGNFNAVDTLNTASALELYAFGLFAYASLKIIVPVFYALNKTKYPVIGSFMTIILNICIIMATLRTYQHKAIALSTALCIIANFIFLSVVLYREIKGYEIGYLIECLLKIVPVSFLMGAGAYWINKLCLNMLGKIAFGNLISLFTAIIAGAVFYGALISVMGIKEVTLIKRKVISKLMAS